MLPGSSRLQLASLAGGFFKIGLMGFGGVGPIARHVIVDERKWLDDREYAEMFSICQALPGANTVNLAVMLGDRHRGVAGAAICVAALILAPLVLVLALAGLYGRMAGAPVARAVMTGAAASAAGLVLGTGCRLLATVRSTVAAWLVALLIVVLVAGCGVPLLPALAVVLPLAAAAAFVDRRRR